MGVLGRVCRIRVGVRIVDFGLDRPSFRLDTFAEGLEDSLFVRFCNMQDHQEIRD